MSATAQRQPGCKLTEELMLVGDMIREAYGDWAFTTTLLANWMRHRAGIERTPEQLEQSIRWLAAAGYIERTEGLLWRRTRANQPRLN